MDIKAIVFDFGGVIQFIRGGKILEDIARIVNVPYDTFKIEYFKLNHLSNGIGKVQRGMWQGTKILRIETPKAEALQQHIYDGLRAGDDNDYVIHGTYIDAQRSDTWLPDLDTRYNAKPFVLMETATT